MPYFIQTFDKPGTAQLRADIRAEHLRYLDQTKSVLLACGAKLSESDGLPTGGVYLVDVDTRAEAEAYLAADPFAKADLFREVQIEPWRVAFLDRESLIDIP